MIELIEVVVCAFLGFLFAGLAVLVIYDTIKSVLKKYFK